MRIRVFLFLAFLWPCTAAAQPTELSSCLEDGSFCSEAAVDTMELGPEFSCGQTFYQFAGRVAFPVLRNLGPITISVRTLGIARFPLYVEIRGRQPSEPDPCTTFLAGALVLIAAGIPIQCGGVWETIGPLDLTQLGVPLDSLYHVQVVGFERFNSTESAGLACIRVTAEPPAAVSAGTWSIVKRFYRDATR